MTRLLLATLFILLLSVTSFAQSAGDTDRDVPAEEQQDDQGDVEDEPYLDEEDLPEDFTGTLADEEDEDNPEYKRRKEERDAFGTDRRRKGDEEEEYEDDTPAYLLKFNFDSQVVFSDKDGQPYMEVNYNTKIEQEVAVINRRWRGKAEAKFSSDITGNLAGNDLFTCKLDITIDSAPVDLMTRFKKIEETDEEPESYQVAVQIRIKKGYQEDWFSNCTGIDGSLFNTKGDPEKYNLTILENLKPSLNGIVVEEFDPADGGEIELISEPLEVEDEDMGELVTLTGIGSVVIEPL